MKCQKPKVKSIAKFRASRVRPQVRPFPIVEPLMRIIVTHALNQNFKLIEEKFAWVKNLGSIDNLGLEELLELQTKLEQAKKSLDLIIQLMGGEAGLGSADDEVEGVRGNDLETKTTYRGGRRRGGGKGSREGIVGDEGRNVGFGSVDDAVEDVRGNAGEGRRGGRGGRGRRGGRGSREGIVREVEGVDGLVNASGCGSRGSVA
ncbi:hypothetical protein Droror1_Dr00003570 [Drosera rotundifolia]